MTDRRNRAVRKLDATVARLNRLHDTQGLSWREIAERDEFSGIAPGTLWGIANGREPSAATCRALGVRKSDRYRLCYECGRGPAGRERDAQLRAEMAAAGVESFTEYVDYLRGEK